jgi:hypothetical protein
MKTHAEKKIEEIHNEDRSFDREIVKSIFNQKMSKFYEILENNEPNEADSIQQIILKIIHILLKFKIKDVNSKEEESINTIFDDSVIIFKKIFDISIDDSIDKSVDKICINRCSKCVKIARFSNKKNHKCSGDYCIICEGFPQHR